MKEMEQHLGTILSSLVLAGILWIGANILEVTNGITEIRTVQQNIVTNQAKIQADLSTKVDKEVVSDIQEEIRLLWDRIVIVERDIAIIANRRTPDKNKSDN